MQKAEAYFALSRLLVKRSGRPVRRTERNWCEANVVGLLVYLVAYAYAFQTLLIRLPAGPQFLFFIPLAFVVWVFWLIVLYLNSCIIKMLRRCGLTRDTPDKHVQSLLIFVMTTVFAWQLLLARTWLCPIGILWMVALALNLFAAILLGFTDGAHKPAR